MQASAPSDQYLCAFILCVLLIFFLYFEQFLDFRFTRRPYCLSIIVCYRSTVRARETHFIPNGVNRPQIREASLITDKFGLKKDSYILFLGRLVPEKGIRYLVEAFKNVKTDKKLVIAGGSNDTDSFMEELKELAKGDDQILFTGFVQGAMLDELYSNAYIYTLPSDLEGMPLSLLEAMSYGKMDSNPLFATKTVAMHNFIDKVEWKETPKKDYVLYFGRFSEEKGIGTLIKVCKELPDVQFIFAGTGPLEETVNGIKNIKNVGFQKGEALEKLIREARFSIYPSEWYENCPFSVMESLWMTVRFDFELCRFSFYLKL